MNTLLVITMALVSSATGGGMPVILDTDIGDDIDDTWALAMMLGTPQLDVQLIVTASDDTPTKTRLLAKMLELVGRTDIPIATGRKTSDAKIHQLEWLGEYTLDTYPGTVHEDGVQALIDAVHAAKETIPICVIGPQTNLAEALRRDSSIAPKARIVSMAGSVHIGYGGKKGRQPEWNVVHDLPSAQAVFSAPWDITIAPLDTCGTLVIKGERYQRVATSKNPLAVLTMENYAKWSNRKHYPTEESSVLYDTLAVYLLYQQDAVEMETVKLRVDEKGNTVPDPEKGRPVHCALHWKDRDAFEQHLIETVAGK